jgi:hypothetical protein
MNDSTSGPTARTRRCRKASSRIVAGALVNIQKNATWEARSSGFCTIAWIATAKSIPKYARPTARRWRALTAAIMPTASAVGHA